MSQHMKLRHKMLTIGEKEKNSKLELEMRKIDYIHNSVPGQEIITRICNQGQKCLISF